MRYSREGYLHCFIKRRIISLSAELPIVKKGYYALEATGGEVLHANLTYKMGVERFYTLFKTGTAFSRGKTIYSLGLGFGGTVRFSDRQGVSIDASANQIISDGSWSKMELDLLTKLDLNYRFTVSPRISLLVGPSLNGYLTQKTTNGRPGTLAIPYSLFFDESTRTKPYFWFGGNAGLAYTF